MRRPKLVVVAAGLVTIVVTWAAVRELLYHQEWFSLSVVMKSKSDWYSGSGLDRTTGSGCGVVQGSDILEGTALVNTLQPACINPKKAVRRLVAVGDSHTITYRTMLWHLANEENFEITTYTRTGCGFGQLAYPTRSPDCKKFVTATINAVIANSGAGDVVFLSSLRIRRFGDQWGAIKREVSNKTQSAKAG